MEAVRRNQSSKRCRSVIGNEWLTSANRSLCEDRAIECWGRRSDEKTPRNELTYRRQHIICRVYIVRNLS